MKSLTSILAGSIALALAGSAVAANIEIVITGSTAFRAQTNLAICKKLTSPHAVYKGGSLSGHSLAIIRGTIGADTVTVKTSWSGSVGGVQTVSQGMQVKTLPDSELDNATPSSTVVTVNGTSLTGGLATVTTSTTLLLPDVAMSDSYQSSTSFNATQLYDKEVGVVGFKWVASNGAPAGLSNITPSQAQVLWLAGEMPLSFFTNNANDATVKVFATGRDPDSGTRLTAFAESGIGIFQTVVQYKPTISGSAVTGQIPYPAGPVNGITVVEGNNGEASGGTVATNLTKTTLANLGGYYISYLGTNDANNAVNGGAKELTWNGVLYSDAAVKNGTYTFWCYEHLMYRTTLAADKMGVADAIATQIELVDAPILLSDMTVQRAGDGANVVPGKK